MLKGIPKCLSPELLKVLMEMGHGDEIVLGDANFPHTSCGQRVVRCDGLDIPELLDAILRFFPLDVHVPAPVGLMAVAPPDDFTPEIWAQYRTLVEKHAPGTVVQELERHAFYARAKQAFCVVATGEGAVYANILLTKGVVKR